MAPVAGTRGVKPTYKYLETAVVGVVVGCAFDSCTVHIVAALDGWQAHLSTSSLGKSGTGDKEREFVRHYTDVPRATVWANYTGDDRAYAPGELFLLYSALQLKHIF